MVAKERLNESELSVECSVEGRSLLLLPHSCQTVCPHDSCLLYYSKNKPNYSFSLCLWVIKDSSYICMSSIQIQWAQKVWDHLIEYINCSCIPASLELHKWWSCFPAWSKEQLELRSKKRNCRSPSLLSESVVEVSLHLLFYFRKDKNVHIH